MEYKNRKKNRLENYGYKNKGAYFLTICTKDKKHIFWQNNETRVGADIIRPNDEIKLSYEGEVVKFAIENIKTIYNNISVNHYVIMPNHIHIILEIKNDCDGRMISAPTRSVVIGQMKRYCSKIIGRPIWQKSFYDHIIRNDADYLEKANYILTNPHKWSDDEYYTKDEV
ncbi:MAG: hypothetical protein IKU54_02865 [Oscillospiraceae bacterium]|nr:hypothetical protein [Oscillospiraceae bacterium]